MTDAKATPARERIAALDAIRGMAILGILAVNASFFAAPVDQALDPARWPFQPQSSASLATFGVMQTFFEAKMISMFSMLFGVSVYLVGGERGDSARSPALKRRLWWLLLFGALHGLFIWYGDILYSYALCGFIVMLFRSRPAGWLIKVGGGIWLAIALLGLLGGLAMTMAPAGTPMGVPAADYRAGFGGDFVQSLTANMREWLQLGLLIEVGNVLNSAPLMLLGMGLYKAGVLRGTAARGIYLGLIAGGAVALAILGAFTVLDVRNGFAAPLHFLSDGLTSLAAVFITLGYGSLLILGLRAGGAAAALPRLLQPVGRMAFTNYLTQSLIMTIIFYGGRGPGLFGEVDRPGLAAIVVGVWLLQIVWSHLWLARFSMGPFEWVWRSLVAKRALPLRVERSRQVGTAGA